MLLLVLWLALLVLVLEHLEVIASDQYGIFVDRGKRYNMAERTGLGSALE